MRHAPVPQPAVVRSPLSRRPPSRRTGRLRRTLALGILTLAIGLVAGCTRNVQVGSPRPLYSIQVRNTLADEMIVSYDDGAGTRALGTVLPNGIERFLINAPASTTITVTARNTAGTDSVGPFMVRLSTGSTPLVVLQ